ncbi:MAG TPA: hypothetical protein VJ697_02350 [Nitrososphaeraceae archaeon]|nr:hypothetical protein [Nitrososphaeraceae archaeon]
MGKQAYSWMDEKDKKEIEHDLILIANDYKISNLVEYIKFKFDRHCKEYYKHKNTKNIKNITIYDQDEKNLFFL